LAKLHLITPSDLVAVGTIVFSRYIDLVRKLQRTYWLEPAGSHGVWSLDDYQFLVFLFGSSQLSGHARITPRSVTSSDIRESLAGRYLYLDAIEFVCSVKTSAPFAEHSPILHDISTMPSWDKVNEGLIKMYRGEVLSKLPIIQHFIFGKLFVASWTPSRTPVAPERNAHVRLISSTLNTRENIDIQPQNEVPVDTPEAAVAPWVLSPPNIITTNEDIPQIQPSSIQIHTSSSSTEEKRTSPISPTGDGVVAMIAAFGPPITPLYPPNEAEVIDARIIAQENQK
jgi:Phosphotyrosyl phosphate activator (PTPA) protein